MRFSYRMVPEVYRLFWAAMARGEFITDAAVEAGTYRKQGTRWLVAAGGVRPRRGRGLKGRCLTLAQREEIALGRARGQSVRSIRRSSGSGATHGRVAPTCYHIGAPSEPDVRVIPASGSSKPIGVAGWCGVVVAPRGLAGAVGVDQA
jgi:hypothetical protein